MSIGEILIAIFVLIMFTLFIYAGMRFFKYSQRERREIANRNEIKRNKNKN